jgi:hypothetical protein
MAISTAINRPWGLSALLRGEPDSMLSWVQDANLSRITRGVVLIVAGTGLYGAAMGCWRSPAQAGYVAIKFPLIILLTTAGNALLNGMLAPLLGLRIPLRWGLAAQVLSFAIAAAILGSFSPLIFFLVYNCPSLATPGAGNAYSLIMLLHVAVIAIAGVTANLRLELLLRHLGGSTDAARKTLFAWLAGNLFLGSQVSWILRPFIGSPDLAVQFIRNNALQGNFYEAVFHSLKQALSLGH